MANPFSRVLQFFKTKSYWTYLGSVLFGESANMPTNRDYLDAYEASFLVNTCIRKIAEKVANTKFRLYEVKGRVGKEEIKEVKNHPLLDLLAQVNPFTTKFEMMDLTQTFIELLGNAYWYKVRNESKTRILELWQLRPDRVRIMEDPIKIISEYQYTLPNGTIQIFQPEDIIHFKQPNPKSSLYGLPTVKAAMEVIQSSVFTTRWNKNFFYNQARPDMVVLLKAKQTPEEKEEMKKKWQTLYGGVEQAHKTAVFSGEDLEIKDLTMTMKEMEFSKLSDVTTQQILSAFGVPKPIVAMTTDLNRATAEAAISTFLSETIEPKIRRITERLNEFLVPEFGDNLYLDFDDPTPENRDAVLQEYDNALRNNWRVINEVRDLEGLPPLEGGWDFYLPITLMPAGGIEEEKNMKRVGGFVKIKGIDKKEYEKYKEEKKQGELRDKVLAGKRKLKLKMELKEELRKLFIRPKRKALTKDEKKIYWQEHDKLLMSNGKLFRLMVKGLFKSQKDRIQDAFKIQFTGKGIDSIVKSRYDLIDWDVEKQVFVQVSVPVFTEIIKTRGQRAAKLIGAEGFDITDKIKKFIDKKVFKFADEVNETTKARLKETLKEGVGVGEGIDELSDRIADVFKQREGYDTERIARTEVISASNEADIEAYKQSEVIEKKEWLATMDDRVRESHAEMDGEVVDLDEPFSNGLKFPGDPIGDPEEVINCRCTTLPVLEEV